MPGPGAPFAPPVHATARVTYLTETTRVRLCEKDATFQLKSHSIVSESDGFRVLTSNLTFILNVRIIGMSTSNSSLSWLLRNKADLVCTVDLCLRLLGLFLVHKCDCFDCTLWLGVFHVKAYCKRLTEWNLSKLGLLDALYLKKTGRKCLHQFVWKRSTEVRKLEIGSGLKTNPGLCFAVCQMWRWFAMLRKNVVMRLTARHTAAAVLAFHLSLNKPFANGSATLPCWVWLKILTWKQSSFARWRSMKNSWSHGVCWSRPAMTTLCLDHPFKSKLRFCDVRRMYFYTFFHASQRIAVDCKQPCRWKTRIFPVSLAALAWRDISDLAWSCGVISLDDHPPNFCDNLDKRHLEKLFTKKKNIFD